MRSRVVINDVYQSIYHRAVPATKNEKLTGYDGFYTMAIYEKMLGQTAVVI